MQSEHKDLDFDLIAHAATAMRDFIKARHQSKLVSTANRLILEFLSANTAEVEALLLQLVNILLESVA